MGKRFCFSFNRRENVHRKKKIHEKKMEEKLFVWFLFLKMVQKCFRFCLWCCVLADDFFLFEFFEVSAMFFLGFSEFLFFAMASSGLVLLRIVRLM